MTRSSCQSIRNWQYRSRQSSVESSVFSPTSRFTSASSYVPYSYRNRSDDPPASTTRTSVLDRSTSRSKSPTRDSLPSRTPSQAPKNPSIRESSKERDADKQKKKSAKERTARRNSRQNSQQDSSSDEEINRLMRSRSGSQVRRKPRKKSQVETEKLIVVEQKDTVMNRSMQSSLYETGVEDSALIQSLTSQINESLTALNLTAESEGFQSCAVSPLAPSISRSSSKHGIVKNQIIKSPSLVEVLGLPRSDSKTSLKAQVGIPRQFLTKVPESIVNLSFPQPSESSHIDDESQYSAVAHFKPNKVKRLAPVPGLWKSGAENEEFISRNKRFAKSVSPSVESCMRLENAKGEAENIFPLKNLEKATKSLKIPEKKKPAVLKTKVDPKPEVKPVEKKPVSKPAAVKISEKPKAATAPEAPKTPTKVAPETQKTEPPVPAPRAQAVQKTKESAPASTPASASAPTPAPATSKPTPTAVKPAETPKTPAKPVPEKVQVPAVVKVAPEKVKSPTTAVEPKKSAPAVPTVTEKPKEAPKETPKPGIEKKKVLLKKKKIIPIDDEVEAPKVLSEQNTEISKVFSRRAWGAQKTEKKMKLRNEMKGISIRCKAAGNQTTQIEEHYRRKPQAERATVLVDTPVKDVNYSVCKISVREKRKKVYV
nr:hypothetical protein F25F1.2 - Caenorhabditis elegans [Caenorhabditis elegans]